MKKPAYRSLQTGAPQVRTAEAWTVPREDPVLSWQSPPRRNQGRVSCHQLILFPLKQNGELISLTDQHMRYAGDVFSCQTHKHNKKCQKRWKRSRVSVHRLQTATSISIKTNSAEPLSLEPSLTDWRDVTQKTQISKAGSSSLSL